MSLSNNLNSQLIHCQRNTPLRNVVNVMQWWNSVTFPETCLRMLCWHDACTGSPSQPQRHFTSVGKNTDEMSLLTLICTTAVDRKVSKQAPGAGAFWWTKLPARRLHVSQVNKTHRGGRRRSMRQRNEMDANWWLCFCRLAAMFELREEEGIHCLSVLEEAALKPKCPVKLTLLNKMNAVWI